MKYRKNQIEVKIEWIQFKRDEFEDIREFTDGNAINFRTEKCINGKSYCEIKTLEGTITAVEDDYIIKDVNGDFFTCKPDVFKIEIPNGEKTIEMNVKCDNVIIKAQDDK